MTFSDVLARVADLRHALQTQIDPAALKDIGVRGPAGRADEAAFLRLTAWCYSFLFEQGRIVIPFLLEDGISSSEKPEASRHRATRKAVRNLRTWFFHNLTAESKHDLEVSTAASEWFLAACGSTSPQGDDHWRTCFAVLSKDVVGLAQHCLKVVSSIAASADDTNLVFADLRLRINREWAPFQFDAVVESSAARLGEKINAREFRDRRLSSWRKFVSSLPDDVDISHEVERLIDGEVANHFRTLLPISLRELVDELDLAPGIQVKHAVEVLRSKQDRGVTNRGELLDAIRVELNLPVTGDSD